MRIKHEDAVAEVNGVRTRSNDEFDSWSQSYDKSILQWLLFDPSHKMILRELGDAGAAHILDIGCGTGKLAHRVITHHRDARVFGIDLSESMVQAAQHHIVSEPRVHLTVADSEHLPFEGDSFDYIICSNSFHHYPGQPAAVKEMHRALKPGGTLFLTDGYRDNWYGGFIYDFAVTRMEGGKVHHASAAEFRHLFINAGFVDIRQSVVRFPAPFILTRGVAEKG